jgi:hypothetical protein
VDPEGSAAVQLRRSHTLRATSSSSSAAGEPTSCRPVSLMDRMSRLNEAQAEWQKKVEDKVTYSLKLTLPLQHILCVILSGRNPAFVTNISGSSST